MSISYKNAKESGASQSEWITFTDVIATGTCTKSSEIFATAGGSEAQVLQESTIQEHLNHGDSIELRIRTGLRTRGGMLREKSVNDITKKVTKQ